MKYVLLFVVLFGAGSSSAQLNVWRWQNPLPEGGLLLSVQMVSLNVIYACGDNGTFMRTSDNGQTWDIQSKLFKSSQTFNSLSFIDQNYGMCCGDGGRIIKTTDGGTTWNLLTTNITGRLYSILVINKNIAMAITLGGGILRTEDGGATWAILPIEGSLALYSIKMLRPDFLIITGYYGTVKKSIDTGKTWHPILTPYGNTYFSSNFVDDSTATLVGDQGLIMRTTNGGATWVQQQVDSTIISATLNQVDGKDRNTLAVVGDYGTILYTTDGGTVWKENDLGTREHIKALSFFDKENATAVGHDGVVLRTTNGGKDWFFLPHIPFTDILYSIAFPKGDTLHGLTCGYYGTVLRTTNGGASWANTTSGTGSILRCITFMDSVHAIAVGDGGVIIKSSDAGLTWNTMPSGTSKNLSGVSFSTPNDGLVVGDNGIVLRTYLAGEYWTRVYPGVAGDTDFFKTVSFPDIRHAFMSGQFGYYRSVDGGVNWIFTQLFPDYLQGGCLGISFADSLHGGIIYGDGGAHLYLAAISSNGGVSWGSPQTLSTTPNAIHYYDPLHATIVGKGGFITHTSDGITFQDQQSNTLNTLVGVCYGTTQAGTTVGYRGNIMHITTDEKAGIAQVMGASGSPHIILDQNYPNPFAQRTTISYHLPASGVATLEIYSIDGKVLATPASEFEIEGDHKLQFDAGNLASGTYMLRLTCGEMNATREIVIMK